MRDKIDILIMRKYLMNIVMTLSTMNTHSSTSAGKSLRNIRTKVEPELQLFKSEMKKWSISYCLST